ncbi:hypothetical protein [Agrococcus sp. SGAir0287]|uniref:hypothetical protein n=1 Tax=Agrococcus sp. SGAir0287 TaxID=2070347 RepID=UPI0010CD57E7|nr:hypothetical protein [Agrococcus sp. SGAir0287]QCR19767.1 hypothetical protein C1N71_10285 [Agrococcus sp. SGAir0287]
MDAAAWRRRRRRATIGGLALLTVVCALGVLLWSLDAWRWLFMLWFVPALVLHLLVLAQRRPRRLLQRLGIVLSAIDDDATGTVVGVDERQAPWWLGMRGWRTTFLVLVDDPRGYGLWDVRRGRAVEVMRCPWDAVADAVVRDGGAHVELLPAAPGDPVVRLAPAGFRDEPPQLMQTPSRALAFAVRIRDRLHAHDPMARRRPPRRADDVGGWGGWDGGDLG